MRTFTNMQPGGPHASTAGLGRLGRINECKVIARNSNISRRGLSL